METVLIDIRNDEFLKEHFDRKDFISLQELRDELDKVTRDVDWLTERIEDLSKEKDEREEYYSYLDDVRDDMICRNE